MDGVDPAATGVGSDLSCIDGVSRSAQRNSARTDGCRRSCAASSRKRTLGRDVCAVVNAPGQFALSRTSKNFVFDTPQAWQEAWAIAGRALDMWSLPRKQRKFVVPNADHFVAADSASPAWIKGPPLATIGAHNFYRIN